METTGWAGQGRGRRGRVGGGFVGGQDAGQL